MDTTDVLAIIGAVTGITGTIAGFIALGWDYYKWHYTEKVRLNVKAFSGHVSTKKINEELIRITITNTGKIPTTINCISLHGFNSKAALKKRNGEKTAIIFDSLHATTPLPIKLNSYDTWTCFIKQDDPVVKSFRDFEHFIIQVEDTISDSQKPFRVELDKSFMNQLTS
jgi:hypothetical protein